MLISNHVYDAGLSQTCHAHGVTTCSMVLSGMLRETVGAREQLARPLSVVLKPLDTVHADEFGPAPVRLVRITLSQEESRAAGEWLPALRDWRWTNDSATTRAFLSLVRASLLTTSSGNRADVDRLVWETLSAAASVVSGGVCDPPLWLMRVREELDDCAGSRRLSELAASAAVHPVYLARQFRRFFGCSVSGYIHRVRIRRAGELLIDGHALSRVAATVGFADQPHMCRIFRRETGLTPGAFRAAVQRVQDAGSYVA